MIMLVFLQRFSLNALTCMLALCFASGAWALDNSQRYGWEGTINNNIPVSIWFEIQDSLVVGEIVYTKTGANKPICLLGQVQGSAPNPIILMHEFSPSGQITGTISGKVVGQNFSGTWTAPDKITEKNGRFQTGEGQTYPITLSAQTPPTPSSSWAFNPSFVAGTYSFDYGVNTGGGSVEVSLIADDLIDFTIKTNSAAPAFNMCTIPADAFEGNKERGRLEGNRVVHDIDQDCAFELIFYNDFLVVNTLPNKNCSGFCGLGAYFDGIYLKTRTTAQMPASTTTDIAVQLIPLVIDKDKVRLRSLPGLDSKTIALVNSGTMLMAEKPVIQDADSGWYKVVGIFDNQSGSISSRLAQSQFIPAYVHRTMAKELTFADTGFTETFIIEQLDRTAYGQGYGACDISPEGQQRLVSKKDLPAWISFSSDSGAGLVPVYQTPSASAELANTEVTWEDMRENYFAFDLLALDRKDQDWIFIIDQQGYLPAGWVEASLVEMHYFGDGRDIGQLISLHLGAHVLEIIKRWGPGEVVSRQTLESWRGPQDQTVLRFDGLEVEYEDYRNLKFTLTRKGAGLGGIFINSPWCNQDYIEKNFGSKLDLEKTIDAGRVVWSFSCLLDGWSCWLRLEFDDQGLVQKFVYAAQDNNLG